MAGYNRVVLVGNLTRDPEYKQLPSGQSVCRLGLATNRQFKNRQSGTMIQEVCYIDIDVWGPQAESCHQYLQKGRPVLIEGRLKFDTWEDQNGQTRSKHSIVADRVVFLSSAVDAQEEDVSAAVAPTANVAVSQKQKEMPAAESAIEKELFDKIETIKAKNEKKRAGGTKKSDSEPQATGEIAFKDEPPFEDELPF
jgi:single-strand DNA-binding protein